ncbi:MAG: HEAT repeat domain-containing protein [Bacteroidales bacterium]|nr:HEAT repeat domain-containing protein [Bacteroidales bacterium]
MKYLLLLILTLLSNAVVLGLTLSPEANAESAFSLYVTERSDKEQISKKDSLLLQDSIKAALESAYIVAPRDTFPIQVGAYKNKSNAEKISEGMKKLSDIKVTIIVEEGLYKVRITRMPRIEIPETKVTAAIPEQADTLQHNEPVTDTIIDSSHYMIAGLFPMAVPETASSKKDTTYSGGRLVFFDGNSPWLKRIKYFGESFALVNSLIITILFSIFSMIVLLIIILLNRRRMEKEEKLHQYLMEKYQNLIVDYLYGGATDEEFKSIARDNYSRLVLIDQMIDVSVNLKGEESNKLIGLYKHLGLDKDSLARARNFRWHKKIKGFRELAFMNIKDANDAMYKALNSKNEILRMEAQISLVRLSEGNHFEFLTQLKRPFSLWEQITLHDLIIQHDIPVPSFRKWLGSTNDTVVIFSLRMIREFKQKDAEEDIKNALLHKSPGVRLLAVQVAGDLGLVSTLDIMKRMYKTQDYKTCLEIVKAMGKMPDSSMLGFLKLVLDKEDDVQLQIEATKSIEKMGEEGVKALVKIMKSEYKNYNIIVRHVLDRRIN